ncbi:carboxymuconolactone decarboxylase family protein [Nocardioides dongxiaopingii]|uniref:carboxymuconolactone decarboxylase family protein n=1 Tax=Nocardioides sp. S-1144 TaxID=2582905 RepID=UPI00110DA5F4|nr:carboxymuconolactone decarboxylase family protein [Nocardioides sp. S-1144]QCW49325.1 carboxymuconolactone decarboxylase family protein [Nocardioides sp. S-1144]
MTRVQLVDPTTTTGAAKPVLDEVRTAFGTTPAMFRAVANSPAALAMMWAGFGALGSGRLGARLGEQVAVLVADRNSCEYCLAAHTALGRKAGATSTEMSEAQAGRSEDARTAAALAFVEKLVRERAQVSDADVEALRSVGFDDQDVVELLAHVALNLFTNYVNVALEVPLDFPKVALLPAAG